MACKPIERLLLCVKGVLVLRREPRVAWKHCEPRVSLGSCLQRAMTGMGVVSALFALSCGPRSQAKALMASHPRKEGGGAHSSVTHYV